MEHIEQYLQLIEIYKQRFASKHEAKLSDLKKIEGHHIVPRCIGGSNNRDNIVFVSREEHIELHKMLCLCFERDTDEYRKLRYAFEIMTKQPMVAGSFIMSRFLKSNSCNVKHVRRWNKKVDNFQDCVNLFLKHQPTSAEKFNLLYQNTFARPIKNKIGVFTFLKHNVHNLV